MLVKKKSKKIKENKIKNTVYESNLSDEELCAKAQEDFYDYRKEIIWNCPKCNYKISYLETLELETKLGSEHGGILWHYNCPSTYINISNKNKIEVCNHKMIPEHKQNKPFISLSFDILNVRYTDIIARSAYNSRNLDDEMEAISILTEVFYNCVFNFNRDKFGDKLDFGGISFKSYLYTRFKRRLRELQYFHNRGKRSPGVICKCCGKVVGAITTSHLLEDFQQYKTDYCKNKVCVYSQKYIKKNGKKGLCNTEHPEGRMCHAKLHEKIISEIGEENFNNLSSSRVKNTYTNGYNFAQKQIISNIILEKYKEYFPQALLNNNIISLHAELSKNDEENKRTLLDTICINNEYYIDELDTSFKNYKEYLWFNDLIYRSIDILFKDYKIKHNDDLKKKLRIMYHLLVRLYDSSLDDKEKKKNVSLYYEEVCERLMVPLMFVKEWTEKFLNNKNILEMIKNEVNIIGD